MLEAARMINQVRDLKANVFESSTRFVVLKLDQIRLVLAQQEIAALEPVLDVQAPTSIDGASMPGTPAGVLQLATGVCPVYSLDINLQCSNSIPSSHRICAIFRHHGNDYAVTCAEVQLLPRSALEPYDVPRSLVNIKSPIKLLLVNDKQLLLGTTSAALFAHLCTRREADVINLSERTRSKVSESQ
jgi:hypothetical protein